jgi:hypothetical protein
MDDSHAITSIYFDNEPLDVYRTRINREEGAQLFRVRWYGDAASLDSKEYIFVERKSTLIQNFCMRSLIFLFCSSSRKLDHGKKRQGAIPYQTNGLGRFLGWQLSSRK